MLKKTKSTKNNMNAKYRALVKPMPELSEFILINKHPFSCNYQFVWNKKLQQYRRTVAYNTWLDYMMEHLSPNDFPHINWEAPIEVTLLFVHKKGMDVDNFSKSVIDVLFNWWGLNDRYVRIVHSYTLDTCKEYKDGKIYIHLRNI